MAQTHEDIRVPTDQDGWYIAEIGFHVCRAVIAMLSSARLPAGARSMFRLSMM